MNDRLEIQLPAPPTEVTILSQGGGQQPQPDGQETGNQAQAQLDAELAQLRTAQAALADGQAKLVQLRQNIIDEAEEQLLELSLGIARKVLMQEIQAERHEIDPIVKEAISRFPTATDVQVHLNPDDLARCKLAAGDEQAPGADGASFVADPAVKRGECLVETSHGTVESSIEEHVDEVARVLRKSG